MATARTPFVGEDKRFAVERLLRLPANQRALLKAIAQTEGDVRRLAALEFLAPLRLPTPGNRAKELLA